MTAYNAAATIEDAIKSVVDQTLDTWELIVIDDGSSDATAQVARSITDSRIRVVEAGRLGRPAAFNLGASLARAEVIAVHDADDMSLPDRLNLQVRAYTEHPDADVIGGQVRAFWGKRSWALAVPTSHEEILSRLDAGDMPITHCAASFRADWFQRSGGLDPSFPRYEDLELYYRARKATRFMALPDVLVQYRFRTASWRRWSFDDTHHVRAVGGVFDSRPKIVRYAHYRVAVWTQKMGLPVTRSTRRSPTPTSSIDEA